MSKSFRLRASDSKRRINFTSGLIKTATKHVESLQKQLFRAISECKLRKIIRFQLLLKNSYYNKILALYKVAHLNKGKKTAGVDRIKIKLSDNKQIVKIMKDLTRDLNRNKWTPKPVRRVYIPKTDGTKRPLGIPTQYDRVVQFILNTILEVSVENLVFSQGLRSYGFRRHHSTADAIANLAPFAWLGKNVRIIEADISKCFDKISHSYTLSLLNGNITQPFIQKLLEAGHVDDDHARIMSSEGTPQGGVISPTLSNLVLRNVLDAPMTKMKISHFGKNIAKITLTTYADDLVISIVPRNLKIKWDEVTTNILNWVNNQLNIADLELKESKTKAIQDEPFDFLGYEIQRGKGIRLAKKTITNLTAKLKTSMKRGRRIDRVLREINPVLRGVYNYAAKFSSKKMWKQMNKIDFKVSTRLYKLYKESNMGQVRYTDIPKTTRYISVKTGYTWLVDKEYWDNRNLNKLNPRKKFLYRKQDGKCAHCQKKFTLSEDEILETHHIKPKGKGGKDTNKNVILIHAICHKEIHESEEGSRAKLN